MKLHAYATSAFVWVILFSTAAMAQDPVPIYSDNYTVMLENDQVRVLDFKLRRGAKEDFHAHPNAVQYVLSPFKIRFTFPDGTTRIREANAGEVFFGEAVTHASENIGDSDAHGLLIELKSDKAGTASAASDLLTAVTFIRGMAGKAEEVKQELFSIEEPTRAEAGNVVYDLYQSPDNENEFMRFEVWRSAADLELHKATPHLKASFERRKSQGWTTQITTWKRIQQTEASGSNPR